VCAANAQDAAAAEVDPNAPTDASKSLRAGGDLQVDSVAPAPAFTPSISVDARGTVPITYYDLRYLTAGNTTTLPVAAWLLTFPRGAEDRATERRITSTGHGPFAAPTAGPK
jgi:hypothetical protein